MKNQMKPFILTAAMIAAGLTVANVQAATVTNNMPVQIIIENACEISVAPTMLDFQTHGVLSTNIDNTSTMSVTCTTDAVYNIGLNGGASGSVAARTMTDGTDFVGYQLYQEAGRTTVWGDTVGTDTQQRNGTGTAEVITVFGRVPVQTTPPAGTYLDTVLVTVTY